MITALANRLIRRIAERRPPDLVIGGVARPYLLRWFVIPRNPIFNIYLHKFLRDDDDRALHDHPWPWCSILLRGAYIEHTIAAGGIHRRELRRAPSIKLSGPRRAHRIELIKVPAATTAAWINRDRREIACWTLFITGPRIRRWGFHCRSGWVHWRDFTDPATQGTTVGRGCGEI
ncbi:MAG: hypothetical protein ABFC67_04695 [Mizugakiibacter sp.]|uniref:hypothetical protein n=1 Tax=Mizugakiibacter sp. TaxID=1972610 RepID=UPI00320DB915